jgi:hypothetical protein
MTRTERNIIAMLAVLTMFVIFVANTPYIDCIN